MRRAMLALMLAAALAPMSASASNGHPTPGKAPSAHPAQWYTFRSARFAVSFRYPASWKVSSVFNLSNKQIWLQHLGIPNYSMDVAVEPFKAGSTVQASLKTFIAAQHNPAMSRAHWTRTTVGGQPAMVGVVTPNTEGGVTISAAIYIVNWRSHVYEILLQANHKPPLSRLSQFPPMYQTILKSWKFL